MNKMRASGVAIAEMLETNSTLEHLDLSNNRHSKPSGLAFAKAIRINTTLKHLE